MPLFYGDSDGEPVVVASKGGALGHPDWYLNLQALPEVKVQIGSDKFAARARTVTGDKGAALWKLMNSVWPFYTAIRKKPFARFRWSCSNAASDDLHENTVESGRCPHATSDLTLFEDGC